MRRHRHSRQLSRCLLRVVTQPGVVRTIAIVALGAALAGCTTLRHAPSMGASPPSQSTDGVETQDNEWWLPVSGGCSLYVHEMGTGPKVVVLHDGWGMEHSYLVDGFRPLMNRYRFVFYDQRGSLRSPCDSLASVSGHVDDLDRLRVALHLSRLVLVGHGMGGYLAMRYAVAHPDRVAGMSLLAPDPARAADVKLPTQADLKERFRRPATLAEFRRLGLNTEQSPTDPRSRYLEHHVAKGAAMLYHVDRWASIGGTLFYNGKVADAVGPRAATEDLTKELAALAIPIEVLFPADDYLPAELSTEWVHTVPNATLQIVPMTGHDLWIDDPDAFTSLLGRYLAQVTTTTDSPGRY